MKSLYDVTGTLEPQISLWKWSARSWVKKWKLWAALKSNCLGHRSPVLNLMTAFPKFWVKYDPHELDYSCMLQERGTLGTVIFRSEKLCNVYPVDGHIGLLMQIWMLVDTLAGLWLTLYTFVLSISYCGRCEPYHLAIGILHSSLFGTRSVSPKYELLFQNCIFSKPDLFVEEEQLYEVDRIKYLGNGISPVGEISDEVFSRTRKAPLLVTILRRLWRWHYLGIVF